MTMLTLPPLPRLFGSRTPKRPVSPPVELADVQGGILRGYAMPLTLFLMIRFASVEGARAWLTGVVPHIASAEPWEKRPSSAVNLGFTAEGLSALGLPATTVETFPVPFVEGMAERSERLGDLGPSSPKEWEEPYAGNDLHGLVWIHARSERQLQRRRDQVMAAAEANGVVVVGEQPGRRPDDGREHFGYVDGLSQPAIAGVDTPPRHPDGTAPERLLPPGEFLLGYPTLDGDLADAIEPPTLSRNGSFLVYRKLSQDVASFRQLLASQANRFGDDEELVAAKLVGRWRDGRPVRAPSSPVEPDPMSNDFDFSDDPDGIGCPHGAHIRRSNPRASLPIDRTLIDRHRMIRRGVPYGPDLPPGAHDDGGDRGLVFATFQADLQRQFEFVQSLWLHDGDSLRLGSTEDVFDPALRDGSSLLVPKEERTVFVHPMRRYVTTRGGAYFFVPGLRALRWLCGPTLP